MGKFQKTDMTFGNTVYVLKFTTRKALVIVANPVIFFLPGNKSLCACQSTLSPTLPELSHTLRQKAEK